MQRLMLQHFTSYAKKSFAFPESGLVLVTGANGSGKSSIVEGVCFALWGETLRGTIPICGETGGASVTTADVVAFRTRNGTKTTLGWGYANPAVRRLVGNGTGQFETTTKAQQALEGVIGTFDVWRRTHVFSSADAANFTLATDRQRKLFLETVLGLENFDTALNQCREVLRAVESKNNLNRAALLAEQAKMSEIQKRYDEATRVLRDLGEGVAPSVDALESLERKHFEITSQIRKGEKELSSIVGEIGRLEGAGSGLVREALALRKRLDRLAQGVCESCGQAIPDHLRARVEGSVLDLQRRADLETRGAKEQVARLREESADIQGTLANLVSRARSLESQISGSKRVLHLRTNAESTLHAVERDLAACRRNMGQAQVALDADMQELVILSAVERVLGLRGVRVGILARMLAGLERAANMWLSKLGVNYSLALKPYSEKKTGGTQDSIGLLVCSSQGVQSSYRAMSGGERRRIDVALLLALAGDGTLFFDEVFDALDGDGVDAVAAVLGELARNRCVVVITHNEDLAAKMASKVHWRMTARGEVLGEGVSDDIRVGGNEGKS